MAVNPADNPGEHVSEVGRAGEDVPFARVGDVLSLYSLRPERVVKPAHGTNSVCPTVVGIAHYEKRGGRRPSGVEDWRVLHVVFRYLDRCTMVYRRYPARRIQPGEQEIIGPPLIRDDRPKSMCGDGKPVGAAGTGAVPDHGYTCAVDESDRDQRVRTGHDVANVSSDRVVLLAQFSGDGELTEGTR